MSRRLLVPGIPFLLSAGLSLASVGSDVAWQDSGFYLCAVKEVGVLYPPGFVLYLLLCKLWTLLFFFLDFTVAVHLFSSACAAGAAAALAAGARDLLRARGPLFKVVPEDPGPAADWAGAAVGCLAAAAYTFGSAAIYAKGYALYYLVLSLLLIRMIRAHETARPRDFTLLAVLIGLAWQAHPSATNLGFALLLFVGAHARTLGARGVAGRAALSAGVALAPTLALPILASRGAESAFGAPSNLAEIGDYLLGRRFLTLPGAFGSDPSRWASVSQYFWEEMLVVGTVLVAAGLAVVALRNRRLLAGVAAWVVPAVVVTVLFKLEGQHDLWFVAAWLPLLLAGGVALAELARRAGRWGRHAIAAVAVLGVGSAVAVNLPLVTQRGYRLASAYGRTALEPVSRAGAGAVLVIGSDDTAAICHYLQIVRGEYRDVLLLRPSHLGSPWYEESLKRRAAVRTPTYDRGGAVAKSAAWANENAAPDRPVFFEHPPPPHLLRADYALVPAGTLMKMVPRGRASIDERDWVFPVAPEEVRSRYRRARGQWVWVTADGVDVQPEPFERRLLLALLRADLNLADWHLERRRPAAARALYERIGRIEPEALEQSTVLFKLGICHFSLGEDALADAAFRGALGLPLSPQEEAKARAALGFLRGPRRDAGARAEVERRLYAK